uniref:Uncharacterized protein n=1 Tax=Klebsiella phage FKP3 TaxID=3231233 RepID=A0AAU8I094_9CAUD
MRLLTQIINPLRRVFCYLTFNTLQTNSFMIE